MASLADPLRWGLLGTAHINRRLIPAMRAARRSSVAAVASRDAARAASYAAEWNIPVAHAGYDVLLRDPAIDAIYIPLPNSLHVEWTLRALDAGKHVLCEKPLAASAEDVDRLDAVSRARQRVVAEAFMFRHEPMMARILELLAANAVGEIKTIAAGFTFAQSRDNDVRLDKALGGGSLWDIGCYAVNIARLAAGAPVVEAFGYANVGPSGVDETFSGLLRFASGVVATIQSGFRTPYRMWLDVGGTDGTLRCTSPFRPGPRDEIEWTRGGEARRVVVEGSPLLFVRMVEDFVAAALDGRTPTVSLADSRANAAALAALARSAATGQPVQLS
jgi:D-xylose 1-dehydrogenase (NADP+, D-xylono-1,5-lactone-forming)